MHIDILTLFPGMFKGVFSESIIKRAQSAKKVKINIHNIRKWSKDKHKKADDKPYGGGAGMVLCVQPIFDAIKKLKARNKKPKLVLLCPQGKKFDQNLAVRLSRRKHLIFICGRYEGVDERVRKYLVDEEISIGDYILTGGEIPAMVMIDSIVRLLPGVLGGKDSSGKESFSCGLLEYPQYTRPAVYKSFKVPQILLSGNHRCIELWRKEQAVKITKRKRPDLLR